MSTPPTDRFGRPLALKASSRIWQLVAVVGAIAILAAYAIGLVPKWGAFSLLAPWAFCLYKAADSYQGDVRAPTDRPKPS